MRKKMSSKTDVLSSETTTELRKSILKTSNLVEAFSKQVLTSATSKADTKPKYFAISKTRLLFVVVAKLRKLNDTFTFIEKLFLIKT